MSRRIYEFVVDSDSYANLEVVDEEALDAFIDGFETESMAADWPEPEIRVSATARNAGLPLPDFASLFGAVPVVSHRVADVFGRALAAQGELLPLRGETTEYCALNVTATVDLMDEDRSVGDWFGPGRLMTLKELVPNRRTCDRLPPIFKLPQWRKGSALVTQDFVDNARKHQLSGLAPRAVGMA